METKQTITAQPFPDLGVLLTYYEAVKSATAIRKGILNRPNADQYRNMCRVYREIYEPICAKFGKLPVSSFFRIDALNKAIGGAKNSAHTYGAAIDIDTDGIGFPTNRQVFEWVRANLKFDQLIAEQPNPVTGVPEWTHIGLSRDGGPNRGQVLVMHRVNGKPTYERLV